MTLQQPGSELSRVLRCGRAAPSVKYLRRFDEGEVIRWAFRGMLIGTIGVLAMDLWELNQQADSAVETPGVETNFLPPEVEVRQPAEKGIDPRDYLKIDEEVLRQPMSFTLGPNGVLTAEGMIDPGAAERLATELETRGEYVSTVSLNSPGGSVEDAMAMGPAAAGEWRGDGSRRRRAVRLVLPADLCRRREAFCGEAGAPLACTSSLPLAR
jgi:hypothetical protein